MGSTSPPSACARCRAGCSRAIINETAARSLFPGEDPLGKKIFMTPPEALMPEEWLQTLPDRRAPRLEIVGVVGDVRMRGPGAPAVAEVFQAFDQAIDSSDSAALVVRTDGDPAAQTGAIRAAIAAVDPDQALLDVKPMTAYVGDAVAQNRFHMWLLGAFALLASVLAMLGVYGVMAYTVGQRRRELAIRMALGAPRRAILGLVLGRGAVWIVAGLTLGTAGAVAMTRLLAGMLFGVSALDPLSFGAGLLVLAAAAVAALLAPARRATRVDPMLSLREE